MLFFVHGRDADGVEDRLAGLSEAHWAYMDGYSAELIARGPTLSADGELHTGSVHVVDLTDPVAAQRFATDEPFAAAGLYDDVLVTRFVSVLASAMFERPYAGGADGSTLVLARWSPTAYTADQVAALGCPSSVAGLMRA